MMWLKGLLLGLAIAAPVGPIGILCMRRTLAYGRFAGLISGLGAASADAIYGSIAAFGLTFISTLLVEQRAWMSLIGGCFLVYLGWRTFISVPQPLSESPEETQYALSAFYFSTWFLTLTNPMTILAFTAIFAGLGLVETDANFLQGVQLVVGVFCGSALWWFILSYSISLFRTRFSLIHLQWINRLAGIVIVGFGIFQLINLISNLD